MKIAGLLEDAVLVALVTLGLAWTFGHVALPSTATDLLVHGSDRLGIHGIEAVEEFYMAGTLGLSSVVALAAVAARKRLRRRSA